jgi:hypothetical protein
MRAKPASVHAKAKHEVGNKAALENHSLVISSCGKRVRTKKTRYAILVLPAMGRTKFEFVTSFED